jgi:hypothetical protein
MEVFQCNVPRETKGGRSQIEYHKYQAIEHHDEKFLWNAGGKLLTIDQVHFRFEDEEQRYLSWWYRGKKQDSKTGFSNVHEQVAATSQYDVSVMCGNLRGRRRGLSLIEERGQWAIYEAMEGNVGISNSGGFCPNYNTEVKLKRA